MYKFSVLNEEGHVIDVILADSKELAEQLTGMSCVQSLDAGIGWTFDAEVEEFVAPEPVEVVEVVDEPAAIEAPAPSEE